MKIYQFLFNKDVVLDANIIIDLYQLNILNLSKEIFSKRYIPENIIKEELHDEEIQKFISEYSYKPVNITSSAAYIKFIELKKEYPKLSVSDVILICTAFEHNLICITNDKRAKNACIKLGIETGGTLGILGCFYENNIITKENLFKLVKDYTKINCRLNNDVVRNFLTELFDLN